MGPANQSYRLANIFTSHLINIDHILNIIVAGYFAYSLKGKLAPFKEEVSANVRKVLLAS